MSGVILFFAIVLAVYILWRRFCLLIFGGVVEVVDIGICGSCGKEILHRIGCECSSWSEEMEKWTLDHISKS